MAKCLVQVSESIALIHVGNSYCWVIDSKNPDKPQQCHAPQMYNIHLGQFFEEINMDIKYPYSRVSEMLQKKKCQSDMLSCALPCMDKETSLQLRKKFAGLLNEHKLEGHGLLAFEWLSDLLLNTQLPAEADINQEILDCMPQRFQELFQQVFKKYRNVDI